jgi:hypothetical protein
MQLQQEELDDMLQSAGLEDTGMTLADLFHRGM